MKIFVVPVLALTCQLFAPAVFAAAKVNYLNVEDEKLIFSLEQEKSQSSPACVTSSNQALWAVSLKNSTGRAMHSLLMNAMTGELSLDVLTAGDCADASGIERPAELKFGTDNKISYGNLTAAEVTYLNVQDNKVLFAVAADKAHSIPGCATGDSNHLWGISLANFTGRAMYSNVITALSANIPVNVSSAQDCGDTASYERPLELWFEPLVTGQINKKDGLLFDDGSALLNIDGKYIFYDAATISSNYDLSTSLIGKIVTQGQDLAILYQLKMNFFDPNNPVCGANLSIGKQGVAYYKYLCTGSGGSQTIAQFTNERSTDELLHQYTAAANNSANYLIQLRTPTYSFNDFQGRPVYEDTSNCDGSYYLSGGTRINQINCHVTQNFFAETVTTDYKPSDQAYGDLVEIQLEYLPLAKHSLIYTNYASRIVANDYSTSTLMPAELQNAMRDGNTYAVSLDDNVLMYIDGANIYVFDDISGAGRLLATLPAEKAPIGFVNSFSLK